MGILIDLTPRTLRWTGINVTAFTLRMLEQRRLDPLLYEVLVKLMPAARVSACPSQDTLVLAGFSFFNDFYGELAGWHGVTRRSLRW